METGEEVRWSEAIGKRLREGRGRMSKREAARRAGFSEATWRALELGVRRPAKGIEVPVNPTVENLVAAAEAVGINPDEILSMVGLAYQAAFERVETATNEVQELRDEVARLAARVELLDRQLDARRSVSEAPPPQP